MRALLTSSGITNGTIEAALVELLGKPIEESGALVIPTALYPFPGGPQMVWRTLAPESDSRFTALGWRSLGILELTALPGIDEEAWAPTVQDADALLVCGGDPLFLAGWLHRSGLAELMPKLRPEAVYVGVSAGSIAATSTFVETYREPPRGKDAALVTRTEDAVFSTPDGDIRRTLVSASGAGLVDFAVIPHYGNPNHPDASEENAEIWASHIPAPVYAIDDDTAVKVTGEGIEVVTEGRWRLFER